MLRYAIFCQFQLSSIVKPFWYLGINLSCLLVYGGLEGGICCNWGCVFKWKVGIVICLSGRRGDMVVVFGFICVVATAILPSSPPKQLVINFSKGSLKHHPAM